MLNKRLKIQIHDENGKLVHESIPNLGVSNCLVELNDIERGSYMLSILDNSGVLWSEVFVKQ